MKWTITATIIAILLVGGAFALTSRPVPDAVPVDNVSIADGKQIIEIRARGGYQPRKSIAQAGLPTIIRFDATGTFDCSSAVRIPSLGLSKNLPSTGTTDIDIGTNLPGTLKGSCGMGMYPFEVEFI